MLLREIFKLSTLPKKETGGLSSNLITPRGLRRSPIEGMVFNLGDPIPQATVFYYPIDLSIHSPIFFSELFKLIEALLSSGPNAQFSLMVQAELPSGGRQVVYSIYPM